MNGDRARRGVRSRRRPTLPLVRWLLADTQCGNRRGHATRCEAYRFDEYAAAVLSFHLEHFLRLVPGIRQARCSPTAPHPRHAAEIRAAAPMCSALSCACCIRRCPFVTEELWDRFGYGEPCSLIRADWPEPGRGPRRGRGCARNSTGWCASSAASAPCGRDECARRRSSRRSCCATPRPRRSRGPAAGWRRSAGWRGPKRAAPRRTVAARIRPAGPRRSHCDPAARRRDRPGGRAPRLARERDKSLAEASKVASKLDNPDFVARAQEEVVNDNRERLAALRDEAGRLEQALARLS